MAGIGDKAFFMIPMPGNKYNRLGLLAVYAGPRIVQLTLDAQGDEPIEATRTRLERSLASCCRGSAEGRTCP